MKKGLLFLAVFLIVGCTYEGKKIGDYLDDPKAFIRDPHFSAYKEKRDTLEREYLRKEISYADYIERRKELDDQYDQEVQWRTEIIQPEM